MDLDGLLDAAAPRTEDVRVCLRGDLVTKHIALVEELNAASGQGASLGGNPEASRISGEILAVQAEQEASSIILTIGTVNARKWANLMLKHPPTREQRAIGSDHNSDTFPPAALAACCEQVNAEQAERLFNTLTPGEWNRVWLTILGLNVAGMPYPKLAAASEILEANAPSLGTPAPTVSPEASSSDGSGDQSPPTSTDTADD